MSERFIRTLKENRLWVTYFATIEELRMALIDFMRIYNEQGILGMILLTHRSGQSLGRRPYASLIIPQTSVQKLGVSSCSKHSCPIRQLQRGPG